MAWPAELASASPREPVTASARGPATAGRRDLVAAPAEERLLGDVELGAVDLALDHVQPESIRANLLDEGRARDGLEDVCGDRRRDEPALANHEERRAGALGDVSLLVEQNRRVIAVGPRLQGRESAVLVVRAALEPDRDRVVGGTRPRADAAAQARRRDPSPPAGIDVEAPR